MQEARKSSHPKSQSIPLPLSGTVVAVLIPNMGRRLMMKTLNVKWVPETFTLVTSTVSAAPSADTCAAARDKSASRFEITGPGKLIIISEGNELSAHVATLQ